MALAFVPITDSATMQHMLRLSKKVSEVGQQYAIVTFDIAAAKNFLKAHTIVWQNEGRFGNVVIRLIHVMTAQCHR